MTDIRSYLDVLGRDGLFDEGAENLVALLIVKMAKQKVALNGVLETADLVRSLFVEGRAPVIICVGTGFQRLGRDRCSSVKVVLRRIAVWVGRRADGRRSICRGIAAKDGGEPGSRSRYEAASCGRGNSVLLLFLNNSLHHVVLRLVTTKRVGIGAERARERTRHVDCVPIVCI